VIFLVGTCGGSEDRRFWWVVGGSAIMRENDCFHGLWVWRKMRLVDCEYESNFLEEELWFLTERGERGEKVNMKWDNELCGNCYLTFFNIHIYIYIYIYIYIDTYIYIEVLLPFRWFSKYTLIKVAKCNIEKIGCKMKKKSNHRMIKVIYPKI
jgi:hypothetical protein